MKKALILFLISSFLVITAFQEESFKARQMKYPRVRKAYQDKKETVEKTLSGHSIQVSELEVFIRIFKQEKELELWGRNHADTSFVLLRSFPVCVTSGEAGPKRQQGDYQIPEGFYHVDAFNPWSSFYLSMRISYPNPSDRLLGLKDRLGGNICIHGACVTIGCVPLTDELIKELYIYCVEARNNGQEKIRVHIYPERLTDENCSRLLDKHQGEGDKVLLWEELKVAHDIFDSVRVPAEVSFLENGRHRVRPVTDLRKVCQG